MSDKTAPQTIASNSVRNPDMLREALNVLHDTSGLSWREIASRKPLPPIPPGTLCSFAKGADMPRRWYSHLGWTEPVPVIPVNGREIPHGSQVHHADYCVKCSRPFISNHPLRKKCFVCSPYRGRK